MNLSPIPRQGSSPPRAWMPMEMRCPACGGSGFVTTARGPHLVKIRCLMCYGTGEVEKE